MNNKETPSGLKEKVHYNSHAVERRLEELREKVATLTAELSYRREYMQRLVLEINGAKNYIASLEDKVEEQKQELERLAKKAMEVLGVSEEEYEIVVEESTVYGFTFDIEINGMEVASGAYGPHDLDPAWGVFDTWVGIGFGIERLTMALNKGHTIKRYGRSIAFIDGQPLNV